MFKRLSFLLVGVTAFALLLSFQWPSKLQKKIDKAVIKTFQIESPTYMPVDIAVGEDEVTASNLKGHLFKVMSADQHVGYVYVDEAPSMKDVFDYAVLLDTDIKVVNAKVLIYREQHGRQIGTRRWLKQFMGMGVDDKPELGVNVDGISGATISATSMTKAMSDILSSLRYLKSIGKV